MSTSTPTTTSTSTPTPTPTPTAGVPTTAELAGPLAVALATADERLIDLLADDVVLRASGRSPWSGHYAGKDAVVTYLFAIGIAFPETTTEILDTLVSPTRIAFLLRLRLERDGHAVEDESLWTMTFDAAGKIADWELNDLDQYAMDDFFNHFPEPAPGKG